MKNSIRYTILCLFLLTLIGNIAVDSQNGFSIIASAKASDATTQGTTKPPILYKATKGDCYKLIDGKPYLVGQSTHCALSSSGSPSCEEITCEKTVGT